MVAVVRVGESARKRGIPDEDMFHALRNYLRRIPDQGAYGLTMYIGPARDGAVLEIGVADDDEEDARIVHAMPARPKYWP